MYVDYHGKSLDGAHPANAPPAPKGFTLPKFSSGNYTNYPICSTLFYIDIGRAGAALRKRNPRPKNIVKISIAIYGFVLLSILSVVIGVNLIDTTSRIRRDIDQSFMQIHARCKRA